MDYRICAVAGPDLFGLSPRAAGPHIREVETVATPVKAASLACPHCGFAAGADAHECVRCGVVFAKVRPSPEDPQDRAEFEADAPPVDPAPPIRYDVEFRPSILGAEARRALLVGAGLAALFLAIPFLRFVLSYLIILVHELGHAIFAWAFGYPAVPAFDFHYGGGLTSYGSRKTALQILIYVGWAAALYAFRRHRPGLIAVGGLIGVYSLFALTSLHEHLIGFMGHGTELVFAGIFLYRALSGSAVKLPVERPLYAFLALFMLASDLRFAFGLVSSPLERQIYAEAKGGGDWMDFSVIAHSFGVELTSVAAFFLVLTLLVAPATWMIYRHRFALGAAVHRIFLEPWYPHNGPSDPQRS